MLKTLSKQTVGFRLVSILTPLMMIGEVVMEMVIPRLMATIIDDGVTAGNMTVITTIGIYMIGAALLGLLFGALGGMFGARASSGFARNLRKAMYRNIQTFSFANIDKYSTSGLVTRMTTDVTNIQNAYQMILRMGVRAPISMIVAMAMAFSINAKLSCVYLVAVVFLAVIMVVIMGTAGKYFSASFKRYDKLNESVQENVSAVRVVKAYVREDFESKKFANASGEVQRLMLKAEQVIACVSPVMMGTVYTCILLISWLGAKMIVLSGATELTTGDLMSMLTYCMNILMSLMMLSMIFVMVSMSTASMERVAQVLDEKATLTNGANPVMEVKDGSVRFNHVSFSYKEGGNKVLDDITLEIKSGETVGILGGTGSGKSSLVQMLPRLYDVTEGSVEVGSVDVRNYDLTSLRDKVAMVLQKNELFSGTIADNLRWGNKDATDEEILDACKQACADEFLSRFPEGIHTHIEQGGTNVSGGQKQRLCIARALLKKPKILILDDSTSAVDTATDAKIRKGFAEKIPGTTVLIIAQRISSVENADRVVVLDNGRIAGFDTPANLLANNKIYQEVYNTQVKGGGDFDEKRGED